MFENFPKLDEKFQIGARFIRRNLDDEPEWRKDNPTIFIIDDILYSKRRNKWVVDFYYYNDSIDSGEGSVFTDEFDDEYKFVEVN